jgi:hypothetical protein
LKADDPVTAAQLRTLDHPPTRAAATAERGRLAHILLQHSGAALLEHALLQHALLDTTTKDGN